MALRLSFAEPASAPIALGLGLLFGNYMAVADASVFRTVVPSSAHILVTTVPMPERILTSVLSAASAEVVLRLMCMTAIVVGFVTIFGPRRGCYWGAIGVVSLVAYPLWDYAYFASLIITPLGAIREFALHFAATGLWGWLYWRHGFLAALMAHCTSHLALQPLLSVLA